MIKLIILCVIGYILGSIPMGKTIAKIKGVDLTKIGSGSTGSTNVTRALGKKYGYLVFFLDSVKSFIIGYIAVNLYGSTKELEVLIILLCVLIGNSYSIFMKFTGGKGVATAFGIILALNWQVALLCLILWILAFKITKTVSTAGLIAIPFGPITLALTQNYPEAILGTIVYLFILYRHKSNIIRLINGEENSFKK